MNKAIFLDRDGVINKLVFNPLTGEYEAPHFVKDLVMFPYVIESLGKLQDMGYLLFLISNQPDYAKGKASLENLQAIHDKLNQILVAGGISFSEYFYCYHHPNGVVPEYTGICQCRKPSPYFIQIAQKKYNLDPADSWLVGDRDTDILCGQGGGLKTILISVPSSLYGTGISKPDFRVSDLHEATRIIVQNEEKE